MKDLKINSLAEAQKLVTDVIRSNVGVINRTKAFEKLGLICKTTRVSDRFTKEERENNHIIAFGLRSFYAKQQEVVFIPKA